MQTFCSADRSCMPGDGTAGPNVGCRSHDECPEGKLCTLEGACVTSPHGGPVTGDTTGGDTGGARDIATSDDAANTGDTATNTGDSTASGDATTPVDGQTADTTLPQHPDDACLSNADCGLTGTCVNGECFFGCRADNSCPPGQECTAHGCRARTVAENACTFNGECGTSHVCQEGTCYRTCQETTECGANERCAGGLCEANTAPVIQCSGPGSCPNGLGCMDGKCVSPCNGVASCNSDAFSCSIGYCMPAPACFNAANCNGADCVNGACE